jgi:hypothetical protein
MHAEGHRYGARPSPSPHPAKGLATHSEDGHRRFSFGHRNHRLCLRLIVEAKARGRPSSIQDVRNAVGLVTDVNQNYTRSSAAPHA